MQRKAGFAVFFMVAVLGAVFLLISQVPLTRNYYDVIDTCSFSFNEPMTFYFTFEANGKYRFEVKGVNWTYTPGHFYYLRAENDTNSSGLGSLSAPPWVWDWSQEVALERLTGEYKVTLWHYEDGSTEIERATILTSVEISQFKETTYHLTYLIYVGLPLLIIGAILITIVGKDVDSARDRNSISQMIE